MMALDKGLYSIHTETTLTRRKIFNELRRFDTSCHRNINGVEGIFSAIGLTSLSNGLMSPEERESENCVEIRPKREVSLVGERFCNLGKRFQQLVLRSETVDVNSSLLLGRCKLEYQRLSTGNSTLTFKCSKPSLLDLRRFLECCVAQEDRKLRRDRRWEEQNPYLILDPEDHSRFYKRAFFPHVWLCNQKINTGSEGTISLTVRVPDANTLWVIQGLAFSKQGFCAADPIFLRAFKHLFVKCHLPFSLRRQEQVSIPCTVYNHRERGASDERTCLRLVDLGEDICTTAGSGQSTEAVCFFMKAQSTKTVSFPVVPLKIGKYKLIVRLTTDSLTEDVKNEIMVEPEGATKENVYGAELDPQGKNAIHVCKNVSISKDFRKGFCYSGQLYLPSDSVKNCLGKIIAKKLTKKACCDNLINRFAVSWSDGIRCELCPEQLFESECVDGSSKKQINTFYLRLPESYVPNSDTAWLSITGDYFLGALGAEVDLENFVEGPGGCGEQSIARMASKVAILKHPRAASAVGEEKLVKEIQREYYYQLKCQKPSGAFAKDPHSQVSAMQVESGAFLEAYMMNCLNESKAYQTAFIIGGALECCRAPNLLFFTINATVAICKAVKYLEFFVENSLLEPRSQAIVYSSLVKACAACRLCRCGAEILTKTRLDLDQVSTVREDGAKYWLANATYLPIGSYAVSLEATANALCGYVDDGRTEAAGPLAKWLKGEITGTVSRTLKQPKDMYTVVALWCLSKFLGAVAYKSSALTVIVTASPNLRRVFHINESNQDQKQKMELSLNSVIRVETKGNGLGFLQVHVKYNEEAIETKKCTLNISVVPKRLSGDDISLSVCVHHLGNVVSDQVMVDVDLPTGYVACEKDKEHCLKELVETRGRYILLQRVETSGRGAKFHFQQIGSSPKNRTCFIFRAIRKYEARSLSPNSATVYYYHRKDKRCTTFYAMNDVSPDFPVFCRKYRAAREPLCACGAGRCPKLELITNRFCNACYHDYAYHVKVEKINRENGWQRTTVKLVDELMPGRYDYYAGDIMTLWMPTSCSLPLPFKIGEEYHVQGVDGVKFVLDHFSVVEKWPSKNKSACARRGRQCEREKCSEKRNKKRKTCIEECNDKEKDCKKKLMQFHKYVRSIKGGLDCELHCT